MHPAFSVLIFTVLSGAGCGMAIWLAGVLTLSPGDLSPRLVAWTAAAIVGLLAVAGISSTFHLGHPERAWRAFSQWRTSWLSREGIALLAAIGLAVLLGLVALAAARATLVLQLLSLVLALVCIVTTYATSMIYASLKAIPAWSSPLVVVAYQVFALASGGLLLNLLLHLGGERSAVRIVLLATVAVSLAVKLAYWIVMGRRGVVATRLSALGIRGSGKARSFDPAHTTANYLTREMAFAVGDPTAQALRILTVLLAFLVPLLLLWLEPLFDRIDTLVAAFLAAASALTGLLIERWLFFAEAQHAMRLYYDRDKV